MKPSRMRTRIGGTALAAVALTAGAVAIAAPASAKTNAIAISQATFAAQPKPVIKVKVTYSCDTGTSLHIEGMASGAVSKKTVATGAVASSKTVCDYGDHVAEVQLTPTTGAVLRKGDKVTLVVKTRDAAGHIYADASKSTTL
ncbi:hypothetical protein [Streptomyces violascens]|uniref:hypothetical protein n=1 Tax=Streptomyces violascens TaxID=67381 RepID=UPI001677CF92|nr:hypothetical protein [Streptomyces violascens]GGU29190.1 hypothetical protein GCM10010289_58070 [Streptomyces violascens]